MRFLNLDRQRSPASFRGFFFFLVLGWVCGAAALAQEIPFQGLSYRSWSTDQGLPQDSIHDIDQTSDGYIWLATRGGLVRSDGVRFTVFDRQSVPEMLNNFINDLAVDSAGTLWIGTNEGLLSYRDGRFTGWSERLDPEHRRILVLFPRRAGGVWIGTYGGGLLLLEDGQVKRWTTRDGLPDNSIWSLHEDHWGDLWIGTWTGSLTRLRGDLLEPRPIPGSVERGYWSLQEDRHGRMWVAGSDGLHLIDREATRTFTTEHGLPGHHIQSIIEDGEGHLWIGTYGHGLARGVWQDDGTFTVDRFREQDGLAGDVIWSLFEDREGHIWIGTIGGGLGRFQTSTFRHVEPAPLGRRAQMTSLSEDSEGGIWVTTLGGGVHRLDGSGQRLHTLTTEQGLPTDRLWSVLVDREDDVWIGTSGHGVVHLPQLGRGTMEILTEADGMPHNVVFGLYEGRDETLWMTTNQGLARRRHGAFLPALTVADGLRSNLIRSVLEDRHGDVWIGTAGGGLHRLRGETLEAFGPEHGLEGANIWALHEDDSGTLWVGSSAGLYRGTDSRFVGIDTRHGLQSDNISTVQSDQAGNLWLGTRSGVLRIGRDRLDAFLDGETESLLSLRFGRADGMRSTEIQAGIQPATLRTGSGSLWFPTLRGLSIVRPETIQEAAGPQTVVERVVVDGEDRQGAAVTIPPGTRRIEIHYTSLQFRAPQRLRFRYRLEGFDRDWIDAEHRRRATYTNLSPGDYTFLLTARDEDSDWNPDPTRHSLRVEPFFHQTRGFLGLVLLLLAGTVGGAHGLRVWRLKVRQAELAREVEEATARLNVISGLLPMCACCKKIREDGGYWSQLETYLVEHSSVELTHSLCPDCLEDHLRDLD